MTTSLLPARPARRWRLRALPLVALLVAGACASGGGGPFVWVDSFAGAVPDSSAYAITNGDLVSVQVFNNAQLSTRTRVRADGRISLPLLDEVQAAGRTPTQIAREVEQRLRSGNLVLDPRVTVVVDETRPVQISVLGRVARPGAYALENGSGLVEALANAGGLTEFAHRDRIFVVRRTPAPPVRIRFTFQQITGQSTRAALFRLRNGDVVVAE